MELGRCLTLRYALGTDLLVGTSQGQLLVYDLPEGSVGAVPSLRLTKKDFLKTSRKPPISQLHAVPELNLLLCLADAYVHVHELSSFTSLCVLEKSKGSLFFAADLKVRGDAAADVHRRSGICRSIPADRLDLRVCCVVKRRLQVFELRAGGSFQHIKVKYQFFVKIISSIIIFNMNFTNCKV